MFVIFKFHWKYDCIIWLNEEKIVNNYVLNFTLSTNRIDQQRMMWFCENLKIFDNEFYFFRKVGKKLDKGEEIIFKLLLENFLWW